MAYNIIFYFTDQQRWDTCGCFGQPLDITPNLDRLAEQGVKFNNAFSPQPVCGPCRALFQTPSLQIESYLSACSANSSRLMPSVMDLGPPASRDITRIVASGPQQNVETLSQLNSLLRFQYNNAYFMGAERTPRISDFIASLAITAARVWYSI